MDSKFSYISDTQLYRIDFNGDKFILISDNGGQNGAVYVWDGEIGPTPAGDDSYGVYEGGIVYSLGQRVEGAVVDPTPLPDNTLRGYITLKHNPVAKFRDLSENN